MRDEDPTRPASVTTQMDDAAQDAGGYAAAALAVLHAPEIVDRVTEQIGGLPLGAGEDARMDAVDSMVARGEELALTDGWLTSWLPKPDTLCFHASDEQLAGHSADDDEDDDDDEHEVYAGISILGDVYTGSTRQTIALRMTVAQALELAHDIISCASHSAQHASRHGWPLSTDDHGPC